MFLFWPVPLKLLWLTKDCHVRNTFIGLFLYHVLCKNFNHPTFTSNHLHPLDNVIIQGQIFLGCLSEQCSVLLISDTIISRANSSISLDSWHSEAGGNTLKLTLFSIYSLCQHFCLLNLLWKQYQLIQSCELTLSLPRVIKILFLSLKYFQDSETSDEKTRKTSTG